MIAHIDADSFFASVLVRQNPSLKGKPLLALGMGGGCVIAASYEAKAMGVKTGMRVKDALALVPHALRLPSDFRETGLASQQIESVLRETFPVAEQMSIDEWFVDLRMLPGGVPPARSLASDVPPSTSLETFGRGVRSAVLRRTGLSVSVGIAPSKLLAKMASEYRKPGGITIVTPEGSCHFQFYISNFSFLKDRPAAAIPGIGPRRIAHCESNGWLTAWDVAQAPTEELRKLFGRPGVEMQRELLGERVYPVREDTDPQQSISRARSFPASGSGDLLWAHMLRHLEYAVLKMRRMRQAARGLSVWLRDASYAYKSTHCPLPRPLETEETLQPFLRRCFKELYEHNGKYTQAGLALWKLTPGGTRQFSLFEDPQHVLREENLQGSLDELHERFGRNAVTRGSAMRVKSTTKKGLGMPIYE
ncbi:MAG: hypothetical protein WCV62_04245 [Candidatus Peribacteraceae bacterium]|jgi:DNA polymerase-4/DNA polymerase V